MAGNQGANQYKQMAVKTANRGQILIMLYEAAIQNVKKAADALDKRDIAAKGVAIGKAHDIINELMNTLDFEIGGNIARDLERLYAFMTEQLVKANLENSKAYLENVQKLLEKLLSGWREAVKQVNTGK
jgi:flagellar secretion chaperone FliS